MNISVVKCTVCGSCVLPCKCTAINMYELPPQPQLYPKINTKGWECPKCGNVYAPSHPQCNKCNKAGGIL